MRGSELDGVVVGKESLQHDFAGRVAAAGAPRNLRQQLKGPFGGAKVRKAERGIGADHAHQRDVGDVVAFGDHLRAHQQINFARMHRAQHALEVIAAVDGVAVKPRDASLREQPVQDVLQLFRACAEILDVLAVALWASLRARAG